MTSDDNLRQLEQDLGLKRLNPLWAKLEIVFGLTAVAVGLLGGMRTASREVGQPESYYSAAWFAWGALIVLGGYLALAGHRSHLYQSNNRLAAYLAAQLRHPGTRS